MDAAEEKRLKRRGEAEAEASRTSAKAEVQQSQLSARRSLRITTHLSFAHPCTQADAARIESEAEESAATRLRRARDRAAEIEADADAEAARIARQVRMDPCVFCAVP